MITIAFCNSMGGVGTTSLVYHLTWMFADLRLSVVAADLDPQAQLTSLFLEEDRLEEIWPKGRHPLTIQGVMESGLRDTDDKASLHVEEITSHIGLLPGNPLLAGFEDELCEAWSLCNRDKAALQTTTAFYRAALQAAEHFKADVVLIDAEQIWAQSIVLL